MRRSVFVSHASEDRAIAGQVCSLLEQRGLDCWIAPRDVGVGVEWDEAILDAIERSRAFLLILSANANRSSFVKNELNRAFSGGKPIVTFRIEDVMPGRALELYLARHHWTDAFPPPLEPRVDQLAASLKMLLDPSADGSAEPLPSPAVRPAPPIDSSGLKPQWSSGGRHGWMATAALAVLGMAVMAVPTLHHLRETPPPVIRTEIGTPVTEEESDVVLSPDGRQIIFVAQGGNASRLWLHSLVTGTASPLEGTEGARYPFWSPDSRSIGFFASGTLRRLNLGGGTSQILAPAPGGLGGTWNTEGVIVFSPGEFRPLMRVPAAGGVAMPVAMQGMEQPVSVFPYFLPDDRQFLFFGYGGQEREGTYLASLDGRAPVRLTAGGEPGVFLRPDWLLSVRDEALVAQRLDVKKGVLRDEQLTLASGFNAQSAWERASVSVNGLIAYRASIGSLLQLTWMDRSGKVLGIAGEPDRTYRYPRVSPDGRRVIVARTVLGNDDLWLLDGDRMSRVTFDPGASFAPVWTGDGNQIVYVHEQEGRLALYQRSTSGSGDGESLVESDQAKLANSLSNDGRFLLYMSLDPQTNSDIWVLPMQGDRKPWAFLKTPYREFWASFSPDGRWVAYTSNESGRPEVYVRPFVASDSAASSDRPTGLWQVSAAGGIHPVWRPDGRELFFLDPDGSMMVVPVATSGAALMPGQPVKLFPTRIVGGGVDSQQGRQYDVAPDGRFLINSVSGVAATHPVTLIHNWNPEAPQRP